MTETKEHPTDPPVDPELDVLIAQGEQLPSDEEEFASPPPPDYPETTAP